MKCGLLRYVITKFEVSWASGIPPDEDLLLTIIHAVHFLLYAIMTSSSLQGLPFHSHCLPTLWGTCRGVVMMENTNWVHQDQAKQAPSLLYCDANMHSPHTHTHTIADPLDLTYFVLYVCTDTGTKTACLLYNCNVSIKSSHCHLTKHTTEQMSVFHIHFCLISFTMMHFYFPT